MNAFLSFQSGWGGVTRWMRRADYCAEKPPFNKRTWGDGRIFRGPTRIFRGPLDGIRELDYLRCGAEEARRGRWIPPPSAHDFSPVERA
jgi:hypothetical protein